MGADGFAFADETSRLERAANQLAETHPHLSARGGLTTHQRRFFLIGLMSLAAVIIAAPATFTVICFSLFGALILWRAALIGVAQIALVKHTPAILANADLPLYSILVALYDEASSVPGLLKALSEIDYPESKLDVHLLLEAHDHATRSALNELPLPANFRVHLLSPGDPQTKPRALNYGLEFAAGEFITIYDAEDRPHPKQIRRAAETFARSNEKTVCLQAPLAAHNHRESWIAAQWGLEYDIQFGLLVPALSRAGFPILLGGTSNHFRREGLVNSGGWDAWNVTEDADLGLRFARRGYTVGTINLPTQEEAPESLKIWAAQRSRWIKGFLQTWIVTMRAPINAMGEMGLLNWLAAQITLGGAILSAIFAGPMAIWLLLCVAFPELSLGTSGIGLLCFGYGVNVLAAVAATRTWTVRRAVTVATLPLYWPLLSLGAARALYGLVVKPHFWAKTPHGLTKARIDEGLSHCPPSIGYSPSAR